jgi:type IV pilus assembly protein PilM
VENKVSLLMDAGLQPTAIDVDAFALHNAFEHNYPEGMEGIVALVNVGHDITNVNILEDGIPILTRDIPFGSRRIREDLQRERSLTAEQAEELVQGRGDPEVLAPFVETGAEEIAVGVERATAFLMTHHAGAGLGRIYLSGGGSRVPGMPEALGTRMAVETHVVNPFERVPIRSDAPTNMVVDEMGPMLLLPLGLALRKP